MTFQLCSLYSPIKLRSFSFLIPGSSRYVKFLPFVMFWMKRHTFYALGRSRCTANNQSEVVTAQDRIWEKDMLRTKSWARVHFLLFHFALFGFLLLEPVPSKTFPIIWCNHLMESQSFKHFYPQNTSPQSKCTPLKLNSSRL